MDSISALVLGYLWINQYTGSRIFMDSISALVLGYLWINQYTGSRIFMNYQCTSSRIFMD